MNKEQLLYFNKINLNGRIYTVDGCDNLFKHKEYLVERSFSDESEINLLNVVGRITDLEISDDVLLGEFKPIDGFDRPENMVIRSKGSGMVDNDGYIKDYLLMSFALVRKEDDSFNDE